MSFGKLRKILQEQANENVWSSLVECFENWSECDERKQALCYAHDVVQDWPIELRVWKSLDENLVAWDLIGKIVLETLDSAALKKLQGFSHIKALEITDGSELRDLSLLGCLNHLTALHIRGSDKLEHVDHLENFKQLAHLAFPDSSSLKNIRGLVGLDSLHFLDIRCDSLEATTDLAQLTNLETLILDYCLLFDDFHWLKNLTQVTTLEFRECGTLRNNSPDNLYTLEGIEKLINLENLAISYMNEVESIDLLAKLTKLKSLDISCCFHLANIEVLRKLSLSSLRIRGFSGDLEVISGLSQLEKLSLSQCSGLENMDYFLPLVNLRQLSMADCENLKSLGNIEKFANLNTLTAFQCYSLEYVEFKTMSELIEIELSGCVNLSEVDLQGLDQLRVLNLWNCEKLASLKGLSKMENLTQLDLSGCESLESIDLESLVNLKSLDISYCKSLQNIENLKKISREMGFEIVVL